MLDNRLAKSLWSQIDFITCNVISSVPLERTSEVRLRQALVRRSHKAVFW